MIFRSICFITELSKLIFVKVSVLKFGDLLNDSTVPNRSKLGAFRVFFAERPVIILIGR